MKNTDICIFTVSLAVIGVYYFIYFKAQSLIQNLLTNAAVYGARIKGAAYPVYLFGNSDMISLEKQISDVAEGCRS